MDIFMNMPLNKAHFLERKSERCVDCGDVDGAIKYLEDAGKCILEAMQTTTSVYCLQSLQMQSDSYQDRSKLIMMEKELELKLQNDTDVVSIEQTDGKNNSNELKEEVRIVQSKVSPKEETAVKNETIIECEREPDSLLQFLNNKSDVTDKRNRKKFPKPESDVIEELQTHNKSLQGLLKIYMDKQEQLENENRMLRKQVNSLESEMKRMSKWYKSDENSIDQNYENYKTPHFILDQDAGPTSIVQQQSFFDFDDPVMALQLQNAIDDEEAPTGPSHFSFPPASVKPDKHALRADLTLRDVTSNNKRCMNESVRYKEVELN